MIKKVIPYTDFDGNPRVEEFWFNLTKAEMMDLGLSKDGGYDKYMEQLMHSTKVGEAIEVFKKILLLAYGKKSLDGRKFEKSPEITADFVATQAYLNKLMWYSDETSYSFNEMTSALSQMTAAGGKIDKMIPMIMGIANATADAGKMGFAFQSTIRNLTQSYSAGHLQLQDWKSLNLMGTATKALKQELIDTAVELGVIKEGEVTIASFESSLQKKWANTKVMEKTFAKYASMMEAAYELTQKNPGMTSSEALEQLKGQYGELAERAALAAQQATSFGQAIDSTKDAVSSKWMSVFETIFGNKEEATDTWTELANRLYDIFVPPIEALNDRMKEGLDSGWQQMRDAFGDQADTYTTVLEKLALAKGAVTEEAIEEEGSFAKALQKGKVDAELLTTSLSDTIKTYESLLGTLDKADPRYDAIQKDYEAFLKLNDAVADGSLDLEQYAEGLTEVSGREHLFNSLWNIMDAIGKVTGSVHEAFTEIFPPTSGEQIHSIAEGLDVMTKKLIITDESAANLKQTFKGIFAVVKVPLTAMTTLAKTGARAFGVLVDVLRPVGAVLLKVAGNMGSFVSEMQSTLLGSGTLGEKLEAMPTTDQTIEYGVNMLDLTLEEKRTSELVNSVTAHGISTVKKGWWIFSRTSYETITATAQNTLSIAAYGLCSRHIYVDGKKSTADSLKKAAQEQLDDYKQVIEPTLTVKAFDRRDTGENVGKLGFLLRTHILSQPHEMDRWMICTKLKLPLDSPDNKQFTFGLTSKKLSKRVDAITSAINNVKNALFGLIGHVNEDDSSN